MIVNIKDKEITLKKTMRSVILYEAIKGEAFNPKTTTDLITYLYATIVSCDKSLEVSFDDFMDWLDDNTSVIGEFSEWLINVNKIEAQYTEPETKKKTRKTKMS